MQKTILRLLCLAILVFGGTTLAFGQVAATSPLSGVVVDQSGATVPGTDVTVKDQATGLEFKAVTAENGTFLVPAVSAGTYTVTVSVVGFKQAIITDVKVATGMPATVSIKLEIGQQSDSITVTGGGEVLHTQTANIATTISGRQITELPFTSRDGLDLVLLLPGTATPGRPRTSSVNGLPKGSLNITIDGVNVQDNVLKSSDGFFTYIRPRIDAVAEVTLSTATPGAESSSEGAVAIKFVTRAGTNSYHGSLYEYHRNPALNANYWYNNRDLPRDPRTGTAPKDRVLLNQYGVRVGGPISSPGLFDGRERAFFFVNYEEYRLPEQATRNRTILNPTTQTGVFQYNSASGVQTVNLLTLAGSRGQTSTIDPVIGKLLADIRATTSRGGLTQLTDPNLQRFTFTNTGGQARYFPTVRFDFNVTSKHHLENTWNYQAFRGKVDFLNGTDPAFPDFPNQGSQGSNRFSNVTALRSTLRPNLINEVRYGITGGTVLFFPEISPGQFANQGGFNLNMNGAAGITNATVSAGPSRRNAPVKQFSDTLTWIHKTHSFNFGVNFTQVNFWGEGGGIVPGITFGVPTSDPADELFVQGNFPGASAADIGSARGIYAVLTGRVTAINATAYLDEEAGTYKYLGKDVDRARQREMGMFISDSWRYRPNLTLNLGLRWEVQFPFTSLNNTYSFAPFEGLYGVSGVGNLFKPGTLTGAATTFTAFKPGDKAYPTEWKNFGPSFGLAYSPSFSGGLLGKLFGQGSTTVIRGGYSIAFNREGMNVVSSILGANPGGFVTANRNVALGNLGTLPVLLRDTARLGPPTIPNSPSYPLTGAITDSANAFAPNLRLGYIQSWTVGIQRELNKDTVIEARYVANHGTGLWRQYSINEVNVIENGFINEFKLAQANLQANIAAGRGTNFRYYGAGTGTAPLPISLAYFAGNVDPNNPNNYLAPAIGAIAANNFTSATFVNPLFPNSPSPQGFASSLYADAERRTNATNAGLAANLFLVNPGKLGGSFVVDNGGNTSYNALEIELRRRMSRGLLMQGSYTFSKALTNEFGSSSTVSYGYATLRHTGLSKTISPFNITHGLKANWIYELPMGRGRWLFNNAGGVLDQLAGGWEFHGTARLQSGTPFSFGNVALVGMTVQDLRDAVQIRQDDAARITYYLPQDIIDNTRRAFNVTATGYSALGTPTGRYIRLAGGTDCLPTFGAQCGINGVTLFGPRFTRFDLSAVKKFRITESSNFEIRAEFLNAFNHINFRVGSAANDATTIGGFGAATFGQTNFAYQDVSTTNDPGGRMIQFVARINF